MTDVKRIKIDVFGRVQGVFFRSTTQEKAQKWGLKGYVKNMPDGSVHIEAEGPEDKLEKLLKFAHNGPSFARIERVESKYEEATNEFKRFRISF